MTTELAARLDVPCPGERDADLTGAGERNLERMPLTKRVGAGSMASFYSD